MSTSTANSKVTIRFATEQGKLHLLPGPHRPSNRLSRRAPHPLSNPRARCLRERILLRSSHRDIAPRNPLFPFQPIHRLRQNPPHLRPPPPHNRIPPTKPAMRRHGSLLYKLLHLASRAGDLSGRSVCEPRVSGEARWEEAVAGVGQGDEEERGAEVGVECSQVE